MVSSTAAQGNRSHEIENYFSKIIFQKLFRSIFHLDYSDAWVYMKASNFYQRISNFTKGFFEEKIQSEISPRKNNVFCPDFFLWLSIHKYLQENRSVGSWDQNADVGPFFSKKLPIQTFFLQRLSYVYGATKKI